MLVIINFELLLYIHNNKNLWNKQIYMLNLLKFYKTFN